MNEVFFLDGEDEECLPVVISVLLFFDGADGEWGGVPPAQVVTTDQHISPTRPIYLNMNNNINK